MKSKTSNPKRDSVRAVAISFFAAALSGIVHGEGLQPPAGQSAAPAAAAAPAPNKELALDLGGGVTIRLVPIPPGRFVMGSPATERDRKPDEIQHDVTISNPFYLGIHEVAQEQYERIMGKNPSRLKSPQFPVDQVTWLQASEFCTKASAAIGKTVRLPTEAEWEYARRAGSTAPFHTGDAITPEEANINPYGHGKKGEKPQTSFAVGHFKPNAWGLHDMVGNVWEWCADWYGEYPRGPVTDPKGPEEGARRVLRGGCWYYAAGNCRAATRHKEPPPLGHATVGFRVAVDAP